MLFSEIYGSYFHVVAQILTEASAEGLTERALTRLVQRRAFAESSLSIPAALKSGEWPLLDRERRSVLHHAPTMPLTLLQKRWLKALLRDARIALFAPDATGLEDVAPLCTPDVFVYFDRYSGGDPYTDEDYIRRFRTILQAVRERKMLTVTFRSYAGKVFHLSCLPCRLEYSQKDDKFRLYAATEGEMHTINLGRISSCAFSDAPLPQEIPEIYRRPRTLILQLHDERNALERVLLHFSHFAKETVKLDEAHYRLSIHYDRDDETELLIRVLSFGPMLEVLGPPSFRAQVKQRLEKQIRLYEMAEEAEV